MDLQLKQFGRFMGLGLLIAVILHFLPGAGPALAQSPTEERPFRLPFAQPPGLDTWLMAQPYGNTTGAFRQRFTTYGASGGIHFGVDLSAPCWTEVVAVADGVVFAVDGPFGSPPHNLTIDHPQLGYASMYGHLVEAPALVPGQVVKQGEVVAHVGDAGETCYSRPHLHLEIRDLAHVRKYNPTLLIEANWDNLLMVGNSGRDFARDLEAPRKWQTLYDQPEVQTGGPIVNDFAYPWPFDWRRQAGRPLLPSVLVEPAIVETAFPVTTLSPGPAVGRRLTAGDCCTQPYWSPDSSQVRFIDQPGPAASLGIWGVEIGEAEARPQLVSQRLGLYSPDESLLAYPGRREGETIIERLADSQTWSLDTGGRNPSFSPDSRRIMWSVYDDDAPSDTREETLWLANADGSEARVLLKARRTDPVAWLSGDRLLMSRRIPGGSDEQWSILSMATGRQTDLFQSPRMRGLALSLDRRYMVYYVTFEEAGQNGLWLLDMDSSSPVPQKLPFFGSYRWRDNERLIYVPFDPAAGEHNFYEYNVSTGQSRPLFPAGTNLTIANNDWRISPDGRHLAVVVGNGAALNGIWLLDLND